MYVAGQEPEKGHHLTSSGSSSQATHPQSTSPRNFFFVQFSGDPKQARTKHEDKGIRAQAARSSWTHRHDRRPPREPKVARRRSVLKRAAVRSVSPRSDQGVASPESIHSIDERLSRANSAPADALLEGAVASSASTVEANDGWRCHLPDLAHRYLQAAISALDQTAHRYDLTNLAETFASPDIYLSPLILQCITLLAITESYIGDDGYALSRPIVMWTRQQLLVSIQNNMQSTDSADLLPAIALLAGWELLHGEEQASTFHLRALEGMLRAQGQANPTSVTEINISPIEEQYGSPALAPGFSHYRSFSLLPTTLVNVVGTLKKFDPNEPDDMLQISKLGAAALSCHADAWQTGKNNNSIRDSVSVHVRLAAGLLTVMLHLETNDEPSHLLAKEMLHAWYPETLALPSARISSTEHYDEIVLWTLCVFIACVDAPAPAQIKIITGMLLRMNVRQWNGLKELLDRYIRPKCMSDRLWPVLTHFFSRSP